MSQSTPVSAARNAIWQMPFRPFFLCAAVFACLAIPLWLMSLSLGIPVAGIGLQWHVHEMLMGFAATVVLGFVLTAAQTWTGVKTVSGGPLLLMVLLWMIARLGWLAPAPWFCLGAAAEILLFVLAAGIVGRMVFKSRNWRNAFFVPVFLLFALFSGAYADAITDGRYEQAQSLQNLVLYLIVHVVLVVGGRVIPFFSDNRLQREPTFRYLPLELLALVSSLVFLVLIYTGTTAALLQMSAAAVAIANLLRWLTWKPWQVLHVPLLWSLYLAYGFIVCGFVATALQAPSTVAIHLIAVGGISLMILAMISRVSLGHSGRPMELPGSFSAAYWLLAAATVCRALANLMPAYYTPLLWLAGIGWVSGFGLFLYYYLPILLSPRPDGKPG